MSAVTIPTNIPPTLVVLSLEVMDRIDRETHEALAIAVTDEESMQRADAANKRLAALQRQIEDNRLDLTRPLDAVKQAAIAAEREGTAPLVAAQATVGQRVRAFRDAENQRREKLRQEAEAERARLQKIEDERAEAERARLQREAQEKALLAAAPGEAVPEVEVSPFAAKAAAPAAVAAPWVPPPLKSTSIRDTTEYVLEVYDAEKVPVTAPGGFLLRPVDEAAVKRYLKGLTPSARDAFPGARLVTRSAIARKG